MDRSADFYCQHFGFTVKAVPGDRITELVPSSGGVHLLLHRASKGQKLGQSAVKLVFTVENVPSFCEKAHKTGLQFGPVHAANGYNFANAKDPDGNSVQVSSRFFADLLKTEQAL
jgi:catechol 2,3-dioxygenase-like lactoylglutathione lyase family enzyme